ncbi:MAG TPA: hypothetical protein VN901_31910, partial [Candidatus Acidoferrales bacterium]|nr:hypothetical protein [Candidatus Acidoferrales bacterium]
MPGRGLHKDRCVQERNVGEGSRKNWQQLASATHNQVQRPPDRGGQSDKLFQVPRRARRATGAGGEFKSDMGNFRPCRDVVPPAVPVAVGACVDV